MVSADMRDNIFTNFFKRVTISIHTNGLVDSSLTVRKSNEPLFVTRIELHGKILLYPGI